MTQGEPWGRIQFNHLDYPPIDLIESNYIIGRGGTATIRLTGCFISRIQCEIYRQSNHLVFLEDKSTNATYVNRSKYHNQRVLLFDGDKIEMSHNECDIKKTAESIVLTFIYLDKNEQFDINGYQLGQRLGVGKFGQVFLSEDRKSKVKYAFKIVVKQNPSLSSDNEKIWITQEKRILDQLHHPYIVRLMDCFETEELFCLIFELVTGGELFDKLNIQGFGTFTELQAQTIFIPLVSTIHYLHSKNILHRDLKPENILLPNAEGTEIKLIDFGLAVEIKNGEKIYHNCGTPLYISPEACFSFMRFLILNFNPNKKKEIFIRLSQRGYGKPIDIWSLGIILHLMVIGSPYGRSQNTIYTDTRAFLSFLKKGYLEIPKKFNPSSLFLMNSVIY